MAKPTFRMRRPRFAYLFLVVILALVAAACGDDADDETTTTTTEADAGVDVATATSRIEGYVSSPTPIPVTEPLAELPTGETFVFVQCNVPECAAHARNLEEAAAVAGVDLQVIPAGDTAESIQGAFASAAELQPAAVFEAAIPVALWETQLQALADQGTPVAAWAIPDEAGNGLDAVFNGTARFEATGRRMADWVIADAGAPTNTVFFYTPEFAVFVSEAEGYQAEIEELCSECSVEIVEASVTTIGSEMPNQIVSYLQENPDTTHVALAFGSMNIGVPEALAAAGLENTVTTISQAGGAVNFDYLANDQQAADLTNDLHVEAWMGLDVAMRLATGQDVSWVTPETSTPQLFVTPANVGEQDVDADGWWIAFPDYVQTFEGLWGVG